MKVAIDLHIHSALSPCAEKDMTPNNIVNMSFIKGLDIIAITDHNCVENFPAIQKCAKERGLLAIPGMEVEAMEEVHLVCLFPDFEAALKMQEMVHNALPNLQNREDVFGEQIIMDEEDNIVDYVKRLLLTATSLGVDDIFAIVRELGGAVIPAHVDRESYSILSNLGFVPDYLNIKYLELSKNCNEEEFKHKNPELEGYRFIKSSDAHRLEDVLERESFIELESMSARALIELINKGRDL